MFRFQGPKGKDLCDAHLGCTRRDFLRVGGAGLIGLTLNNILAGQAASVKSVHAGGPPRTVGELEVRCQRSSADPRKALENGQYRP